MWPLWLRHRFMQGADVLGQGLYRASGGLIGERQWRYHMLLLDSTGRKTGKSRTHTLLFFRDGARYIVVASNFAGPRHPAWYWNLRDNPHARIQVGRKRFNVVATEADGAERDRLWQMAVAEYANYAVYQRNTPRRIPVMVLTPEPN
jgi:deazaflavin-dependent oxidoreductase (nitroreductase family)